MQLLSIKINKFIFTDNFQYHNSKNNIEHLIMQAQVNDSLEKKLLLLNQACEKIEKFHSFFHFEQSFNHLQLALIAQQEGNLNLFKNQLKQAIFQDHNNYQAISLLNKQRYDIIYQPPFASYQAYLTFATEESKNQDYCDNYWNLQDFEQKLKIIKDHHQNYHQQASKIYLNRAKIYQILDKRSLAQNDIIKAKNLDNMLKNKDYFKEDENIKIILCLGSNINERKTFLEKAIYFLESRQILFNLKHSKIIETKAILPKGAPSEWDKPYLNMALVGQTKLKPQHLLNAIKIIEKDLGREEAARWSPRVIDIDILAYGNKVIDEDQLNIPHRELLNRIWALELFSEIEPEWLYPVDGPLQNKTIKEIYEQYKNNRNC